MQTQTLCEIGCSLADIVLDMIEKFWSISQKSPVRQGCAANFSLSISFRISVPAVMNVQIPVKMKLFWGANASSMLLTRMNVFSVASAWMHVMKGRLSKQEA